VNPAAKTQLRRSDEVGLLDLLRQMMGSYSHGALSSATNL
jgi:hypothetical protein